ncbi:hypothetical protein HG531_008530 [Fusarium graminearum]|nr:hypothetical protein HG531_008530 [Fusarium graminearum]
MVDLKILRYKKRINRISLLLKDPRIKCPVPSIHPIQILLCLISTVFLHIRLLYLEQRLHLLVSKRLQLYSQLIKHCYNALNTLCHFILHFELRVCFEAEHSRRAVSQLDCSFQTAHVLGEPAFFGDVICLSCTGAGGVFHYGDEMAFFKGCFKLAFVVDFHGVED